MQLTEETSAGAFFLLLVLSLCISVYVGYEKIIVREEYVMYTSTEEVSTYIMSSADSE
jgi:hypothetical protein